MNNEQKQATINIRQSKDKQALLEQFRKTPIIQVSCERASVSRATYYRFRKEDKEFAKAADEAIAEGEAFITDLSEAQVINLIKEKNWPAISFWLKAHHPKYGNKLEVMAHIKESDKELTPEQQALIEQALKLANLSELEKIKNNEKK